MKYLRIFLLAIQSNLVHRSDIIIWFIVGMIPAFTLVLVWFAILGDRASIQGYTRGDFIVYYFFQTISWYIVGGTFARPLGTKIKFGEVNKTLLKPYSLVLEQAISEQGWKVISFLLSLPAIVIFYLVFHSIINIHFTIPQISLIVVSLIFGALIFASIDAIVGCCAFWLPELWPLADLFDILLQLFGGRLIPLLLMPLSLQVTANFLPFKYIFYIPTLIFLNKSSNPVLDILTQGVVLLVVFLCYKLVWRAGIKKYEAVGG